MPSNLKTHPAQYLSPDGTRKRSDLSTHLKDCE